MRGRGITVLLLALLLGALGGLVAFCGKKKEVPVSIAGTTCELLANAPPSEPRTPLPDDPLLARWTQQMEAIELEVLALRAMANQRARSPRTTPEEAACARRLWQKITTRLPAHDVLRDALTAVANEIVAPPYTDAGERIPTRGTSGPLDLSELDAGAYERGGPFDHALWDVTAKWDDSHCNDLGAFLGAFPPNVRLQRALVLRYSPCVEDNFSSIDGPLDKNERLLRTTAEAFPELTPITFELVTLGDLTSQTVLSTDYFRAGAPIGRTALDLGPTGNALRVVEALAEKDPSLPPKLVLFAKRMAEGPLPPNRRARWVGLLDYLAAGAPAPGRPFAELVADPASAWWALAYVPNELMEHGPRVDLLDDPALIEAAGARAATADTPERAVLALDVLARMPPGTATAFVAKQTASPHEGVVAAALLTINAQRSRLRPPGAAPSRAPVAFLVEHLAALRAGLARRSCAVPLALETLLDANDTEIDEDLARCVEAEPDVARLRSSSMLIECRARRELGWTKTVAALEARAPDAGPGGDSLRRLAHACRTGED